MRFLLLVILFVLLGGCSQGHEDSASTTFADPREEREFYLNKLIGDVIGVSNYHPDKEDDLSEDKRKRAIIALDYFEELSLEELKFLNSLNYKEKAYLRSHIVSLGILGGEMGSEKHFFKTLREICLIHNITEYRFCNWR